MNLESIIKTISINYAPLPEACVIELLEVSKIIPVDKNEKLIRQGQFSDKTFFIVNGTARAYYLKDGKDITDWFASENDFICSINCTFLDLPSLHFIELLEPGVVLEISRQHIQLLSDKYREFDRLEKLIITKTMLELQKRIVSMQFETAKQKYDTLLKARPDIAQRVQLTHIASYLGITLETLSRIRASKSRI